MMIYEIVEQIAVYDGHPEFMPLPMLMEALNYYATGGTRRRVAELRLSGEAPKATLYKIRLTVEFEPVEDDNK